jgi:hypothetical protein
MSDVSLKAIFGMDSTGFKNELKSLGSSLTSFADNMLTQFVGFTALTLLAKQAMDAATSIKDMALDVGISATSYQALQFEAEQAGVSQDKFDQGLKKVKESVIEAAQGNTKLADAFSDLGLDASYLLTLPLDQQYAAIALAVHNASNQAAAYNDVVQIFGARVGPGLMASLEDLAEKGLPGVTAAAEKAGQVMDDKTIVALADASEKIDAFKKRMTVAIGNILVDFRSGPGLEALGARLLQYAAAFGGKIVDALAQADQLIIAVIGGGLRGVANDFRNVMLTGIDYIGQGLTKMISAWATGVNAVFGKVAGDLANALANKVNLQIHVATADIDKLKTTGDGIADSISTAIAQTQPTDFSDSWSEYWKQMADQFQASANILDKSEFAKGIKMLQDAGKPVRQDIQLAANDIVAAGKKAGEAISQAVEGVAAGSRGGASFNSASDSALQKIMQDDRSKIVDLTNAMNQNQFLKLANEGEIARLQDEINNAQSQITSRNAIRNGYAQGGIQGAYNAAPNIDPIEVDKLVDQFAKNQTAAQKSQNSLDGISRQLASAGIGSVGG